jgi:hypothetical protein
MLGRLCGNWLADNRRAGAAAARAGDRLARTALKVAILKQQPGSGPLTGGGGHPRAGSRPKD